MKDEFMAVDPTPLKYLWQAMPPACFEWKMVCELGRHHATIQVTGNGMFKASTRKTLPGLEEEFETMAEAVQAVLRSLGLEVQS